MRLGSDLGALCGGRTPLAIIGRPRFLACNPRFLAKDENRRRKQKTGSESTLPARYLSDGAGDGNRTRVMSLEGSGSAIELHPHDASAIVPQHRPSRARFPGSFHQIPHKLDGGAGDVRTEGRHADDRPSIPSTSPPVSRQTPARKPCRFKGIDARRHARVGSARGKGAASPRKNPDRPRQRTPQPTELKMLKRCEAVRMLAPPFTRFPEHAAKREALSLGASMRRGRAAALPRESPHWSGRQDSNLRHPAPKAGALPDCATSRRKRQVPV